MDHKRKKMISISLFSVFALMATATVANAAPGTSYSTLEYPSGGGY